MLLCLCNQQLKEIYFFETNVPVVKWNPVYLMLILENLYGLKSKQTYFTAAFLHAILGEDDKD